MNVELEWDFSDPDMRRYVDGFQITPLIDRISGNRVSTSRITKCAPCLKLGSVTQVHSFVLTTTFSQCLLSSLVFKEPYILFRAGGLGPKTGFFFFNPAQGQGYKARLRCAQPKKECQFPIIT